MSSNSEDHPYRRLTCGSCAFWQPDEVEKMYVDLYKNGATNGQCRIRAPHEPGTRFGR